MIRNVSTRWIGRAAIILGFAAMFSFGAGAAWADHDHYNRGRVAPWWNAAYHDHAFHAHDQRPGKRLGHHKHQARYYCRPCNHYFTARADLYDHVAHRHRVPLRRLSLAVSFGPFGWIFFG